ncbi:alpha/beta hydrolase [Roseibium sp. MMSF_3544]|uniref:alpha/beta hydrolase n=1 Tax=unclassified Roseibium TaxID=2629323 RepID=UPI00273E47BC|nr:alpha/beta hydrolase [Roseibium sp. MMSF_3544]
MTRFLFVFLFVVFGSGAYAQDTWKVERLKATADVYPGEELLSTNGIETLTYFKAGSSSKPLMIFVPGGFHLARVAYGYPGGDDKDFLAYWLGQLGYSFLGASYPTGNKVYSKVYPDFTIRDWGKQVAASAKFYIEREGLSKDVIVMGWSAGGQIAQSVYEAAQAEGLNVELFVSLASTPPVPLLLAAPGEIKEQADGLSAAPQFYDLFKQYVWAQDEMNGHAIIPWNVFETDILGPIPVALNAIMMASKYEDGKYVKDLDWSISDTGGLKFSDFPLVVTISGNKILDTVHAATDRGNWGIYQIQHLFRNIVEPAFDGTENIDPQEWQGLMDEMSYATSGALNARVPGNHFFWYGQFGARETAHQIDVLRFRADNLRNNMKSIIERIKAK